MPQRRLHTDTFLVPTIATYTDGSGATVPSYLFAGGYENMDGYKCTPNCAATSGSVLIGTIKNDVTGSAGHDDIPNVCKNQPYNMRNTLADDQDGAEKCAECCNLLDGENGNDLCLYFNFNAQDSTIDGTPSTEHPGCYLFKNGRCDTLDGNGEHVSQVNTCNANSGELYQETPIGTPPQVHLHYFQRNTFPTNAPTSSPTTAPTSAPTLFPTSSPTSSPTNSPTSSPTNSPTKSPTVVGLTYTPTSSPSTSPTALATTSPTNSPTTDNPTYINTAYPTFAPSTPYPTTNYPTHAPSTAVITVAGSVGNITSDKTADIVIIVLAAVLVVVCIGFTCTKVFAQKQQQQQQQSLTESPLETRRLFKFKFKQSIKESDWQLSC